MLLSLNILDFTTTWIVLSLFKRMGPRYGDLPMWKCTAPGQWLVSRGMVSPPKRTLVFWYDHELNPGARWLCKRMGLHGLTVLKLAPLSVLTVVLAVSTLEHMLCWPVVVELYVLVEVYRWVVRHNWGVVKRVEGEYRRWRRRTRVPFEDPLLPI